MKMLPLFKVLPRLLPALVLSVLAACAPLAVSSLPQAASIPLQQQSALVQGARQTIGTAKQVFEKAEALAQRWSPLAEVIYVEGRFISANGLNDYPMDAQWIFSFSASDKPLKTFQVYSRSENTTLSSLELNQKPGRKPLEVRAWVLDSSSVLNKARRLSEMISYPVSRLVLSMSEDQRLLWEIPQMAPLPPLLLDAMNGQQVSQRQ